MARPAACGREICEHQTALDIRALRRRWSLDPGLRFRADLTGSVIVETEDYALVLEYGGAGGTAERFRVKQRVFVTWTDCRLGGRRPWFVCNCKRRVAILYAVRGTYECRRCCGLAYASQFQTPQDRALSKAQKIRKRLGGTPSLMDPFPDRPRRMHQRTYDKLSRALLAAETVAIGLMEEHLVR